MNDYLEEIMGEFQEKFVTYPISDLPQWGGKLERKNTDQRFLVRSESKEYLDVNRMKKWIRDKLKQAEAKGRKEVAEEVLKNTTHCFSIKETTPTLEIVEASKKGLPTMKHPESYGYDHAMDKIKRFCNILLTTTNEDE